MPTKQELENANKELERGLSEALVFNKEVLLRDSKNLEQKYIQLMSFITFVFFLYLTGIMYFCFYLRINNL